MELLQILNVVVFSIVLLIVIVCLIVYGIEQYNERKIKIAKSQEEYNFYETLKQDPIILGGNYKEIVDDLIEELKGRRKYYKECIEERDKNSLNTFGGVHNKELNNAIDKDKVFLIDDILLGLDMRLNAHKQNPLKSVKDVAPYKNNKAAADKGENNE